MAEHNRIGALGEKAACDYLKARGYTIREQNYRLSHIEIDVIAENKDTIVFVEVKTRTTLFADTSPEEYVDEHKRRFMTIAGNAYLKHHQLSKTLRFDICGILWDKEKDAVGQIQYYENAFAPKLRTVNAGSYSGQYRWKRR